MVDFSDPQWRFEERVQRLVDRGRTKTEAEEIVRTVITTKEITHDSGTHSNQHE
jgi:hypothetical protein